MKTLFPVVALAATALVSNVANADVVHARHRAGAVILSPAPMTAPTGFEALYRVDGYQGDGLSNDCEGQRLFGFCPVR